MNKDVYAKYNPGDYYETHTPYNGAVKKRRKQKKAGGIVISLCIALCICIIGGLVAFNVLKYMPDLIYEKPVTEDTLFKKKNIHKQLIDDYATVIGEDKDYLLSQFDSYEYEGYIVGSPLYTVHDSKNNLDMGFVFTNDKCSFISIPVKCIFPDMTGLNSRLHFDEAFDSEGVFQPYSSEWNPYIYYVFEDYMIHLFCDEEGLNIDVDSAYCNIYKTATDNLWKYNHYTFYFGWDKDGIFESDSYLYNTITPSTSDMFFTDGDWYCFYDDTSSIQKSKIYYSFVDNKCNMMAFETDFIFPFVKEETIKNEYCLNDLTNLEFSLEKSDKGNFYLATDRYDHSSDYREIRIECDSTGEVLKDGITEISYYNSNTY